MTLKIDVTLPQLSEMLRKQRRQERLSLEQASRQIGVSPATLSRIERQYASHTETESNRIPDTRTIGLIASWLNVRVSEMVGRDRLNSPPLDLTDTVVETPQLVEAHLRADRNLSAQTASMLANIFRAAYSEAVRNEQSTNEETRQSLNKEIP